MMKLSDFDITRNAVWTKDCCGKQDLDFSLISCSTRYWPDHSALCEFILRPEYNYSIEDYSGRGDEYILIESEIMKSTSEKAIKAKVRRWYNQHAIEALNKATEIMNHGH